MRSTLRFDQNIPSKLQRLIGEPLQPKDLSKQGLCMYEMIVTAAEQMSPPHIGRIEARSLFDAGPRFRVFAHPQEGGTKKAVRRSQSHRAGDFFAIPSTCRLRAKPADRSSAMRLEMTSPVRALS